MSHTIKHLTTVLINTIHHLLTESKGYMPILLLDRKVCFKIIPAVSGRTDIVKNEYRHMSFHPIPKENSWERKYFYLVGYFDISPFVLIASQNYRTWNFHYSWQEIPTWVFFIFLGKMSTLGFLLIYIEMKRSDMPKIQKKVFIWVCRSDLRYLVSQQFSLRFHMVTTARHLTGALAHAIIPSLRLDSD